MRIVNLKNSKINLIASSLLTMAFMSIAQQVENNPKVEYINYYSTNDTLYIPYLPNIEYHEDKLDYLIRDTDRKISDFNHNSKILESKIDDMITNRVLIEEPVIFDENVDSVFKKKGLIKRIIQKVRN